MKEIKYIDEKELHKIVNYVVYIMFENVVNAFPQLIEDMKSECYETYAKAIKTYDETRKTKFTTYLINGMRNQINYLIRRDKKHRLITSLDFALSQDEAGNNLTIADVIKIEEKGFLEAEAITYKIIEDYLNYNEPIERNREIIKEYIFICKNEEHVPQTELALKYGMSQANICKIIAKFKNYLKKRLIEEGCPIRLTR